jgi:tRNA dimethylallyltransferase
MNPPALALIGPTASGKTDLALDLATRFPVEIVSLDSAQVFIGMDIGTAKPDQATLARCPHHLIDLITPEESYSAARFRTDALRVMAEISGRGKVPLLVGGTMLYFKALVEGLADLPQADPALRAAIDIEAREQGWPALHAELAQHDPVTAARLAPNDSQRIQRALEVFRLTGKPLSAHLGNSTPPLPYQLCTIALTTTQRSRLHERIATRFHAMLAAGLVDEVKHLREKYRLDGELPSMRCVGYRQVWEMLEGRMTAAEMPDRGIFATRQLAKRQLTWLRGLGEAGHINIQPDFADLPTAAKIRGQIEQHLAATPARSA